MSTRQVLQGIKSFFIVYSLLEVLSLLLSFPSLSGQFGLGVIVALKMNFKGWLDSQELRQIKLS